MGLKFGWDAPPAPSVAPRGVVRDARRNHLAIALGDSRRDERRTLLAALWRERTADR